MLKDEVNIYEVLQIRMTPFPRFLNIDENIVLKQAVDQFQKLFNA